MCTDDGIHGPIRNSQYNHVSQDILEIAACISYLITSLFKICANSLAHVSLAKYCDIHNRLLLYKHNVTYFITSNILDISCNVNSYIMFFNIHILADTSSRNIRRE